MKFATASPEPAYRSGPDTDGPALVELMGINEEEFRSRFSGSPIKRAKRRGLLRNVAVALGNWGSWEAVPALARALDDPEPLIRGHSAWAMGVILRKTNLPGTRAFEVADALRLRLDLERDPWVAEGLKWALRA